ncbi:MAG: hypothetical protein ABSG71_03310 [Thermodesulfobacteriota bacterium]
MIVQAIVDFELEAIDGRLFQYKTGQKIIFKDHVAQRLISQGKVVLFQAPPEPSINEFMDLWQAIFKALGKGALSLKKFDGPVQIQVGSLSTSIWYEYIPSLANVFFTPKEIMELLSKYFLMRKNEFAEHFRAACLVKGIFEGSELLK